MQLYCCGDRVRNYVHYPIRLYTWEHLCISVDLSTKRLTVVLNNEVSLSATHVDGLQCLLENMHLTVSKLFDIIWFHCTQDGV